MALFVSAFLFSPISGEGISIISYGDEVFLLQNDYMDSRWLTGGRKSGNTRVSTRVVDERNSKVNTFIWTVRSNYQITDPKRGQCLKYGDTIYLQVNSRDDRWLTGARDKGNEAVRTRNVLDELKVVNTYQCVVRSNTGTGMLDRAGSDPGHGGCSSDLSRVFLQNKGHDFRWLSGSRNSGNNEVGTFNCLKNKDEKGTNVATNLSFAKITPVQVPGQMLFSAITSIQRASG